MDLQMLPNDAIRYITEFLEYEIIDDDPSRIMKSLFGRFNGESGYFLVFRHLFTRSIQSEFFRFKQGHLYPKDAYSIEYRPLPDSFRQYDISNLDPYEIKNTEPIHFISRFPHLIVIKNIQFGEDDRDNRDESTKRLLTMMHNESNRVYKLKSLHLTSNVSDFTISKNFPEIQDFALEYFYTVKSSHFLDGIELCRNLTHFYLRGLDFMLGLKETLWTCTIVESLFGLPNIKILKLVDCCLARLLDVNLLILETSIVQEVVVGCTSTKSMMSLLSNPNIRSLHVNCCLRLTEPPSLFELVLKKERFQTREFEYVAGVSLYILGYLKHDALSDCKAFLTRGKFDRLKLGGRWSLPEEILKCIPPLKKLEYTSVLPKPKHIVPIQADEIIVNNNGFRLDDFTPPVGCKKLQLNNLGMRGIDLKRLRDLVMTTGIEITFNGWDIEKVVERNKGFEHSYFYISIPDAKTKNECETVSVRSAIESDSLISSDNQDRADFENVCETEDQDYSQLESEEDQLYNGDDGSQVKRRKFDDEI